MEVRRWSKGRFMGRRLIRTSLIVGVGLIVAAALITGPCLKPSMAAETQKPIKLGMFGIMSGIGGMIGEAYSRAGHMWVDEVNARGGLLGRKVEMDLRDTSGKPEEAVRWAREFASPGGADFLFSTGSATESFAVGAVSQELKKVIFMFNETAESTANPKMRTPYTFRTAKNAFLDNIVSTQFAAKKSKELGLTRWYTIAPDYAAGREVVGLFVDYLKKFNPAVQIVGQAWPKLGETDFTPHITAIMGAKPDAVFNQLYTGDMITFIKQASMYGLLNNGKWFIRDLSEYDAIAAVQKSLGKFPDGLYASVRYSRVNPDSKANQDFYNTYLKRYGSPPLSFSWELYTACELLEAAVNKAKSTDTEAVIRALKDLSVQSPVGVGPNGTVTMRGRDGQLINYAMGWGTTMAQDPYMKDIYPGVWSEMIKEETAWLKTKGWLQ